ncbi:MAG: hypothetical protein KatS3mg031_2620 [Chitinophagales bacterium]|nr:MAG: hypothetical protein KatS3mg031_2620 [Chitinophagales bacterium]
MHYLQRFKIGELTDSERIPDDCFNEPFFEELVQRCYQANLYRAPAWYVNTFFYIRLATWIAFFACSLAALYGSLPKAYAVVLVIIQAAAGTSLFGLVAHEAIHRNFPRHAFFKALLTLAWPVVWPFIIKNPLRFEHNSHHIKIGDPHYDYEVAAFSDFIRYSGLLAVRPLHRMQHRLALIFYPFYANIITTIGGIRSGYWSKHNRPIDSEQLLSLGMTAFYYVVLPALLGQSLLWCAALYLVYQCALFAGIYAGAAINHFVPSVTEPIPAQHANHFGYYVCHNTTNFCPHSRFWQWYTGGFHIQIEHHLIPFIPVENLYKAIPIVKELCRKYGYPYKEYNTFRKLWNDHYAYLRLMAGNTSKHIVNEIANKHSYQAR